MTDTPLNPPKPWFVARPRKSWFPSNPRDLWHFRGLLARFTARDLTLRYRQTVLGMTWVVLQPLLGAGVLSFVFGSVAGLSAPKGIPYLVFSFAGMVAWNLYSNITMRAGTVLIGNAQMIQKVFFPRLLLPLSQVGSSLVDLAVSLVVLAIMLAVYGIWAGWALLLLPVWLLLFVFAALGLGLTSGALAVPFRDVQYVLPVAIQFLLFATPIAYSISAAPASTRWLFYINPLSGLFEAVRWSTLGTPFPSSGLITYSIVASLAMFLLGVMVFSRLERRFADVI